MPDDAGSDVTARRDPNHEAVERAFRETLDELSVSGVAPELAVRDDPDDPDVVRVHLVWWLVDRRERGLQTEQRLFDVWHQLAHSPMGGVSYHLEVWGTRSTPGDPPRPRRSCRGGCPDCGCAHCDDRCVEHLELFLPADLWASSEPAEVPLRYVHTFAFGVLADDVADVARYAAMVALHRAELHSGAGEPGRWSSEMTELVGRVGIRRLLEDLSDGMLERIKALSGSWEGSAVDLLREASSLEPEETAGKRPTWLEQ